MMLRSAFAGHGVRWQRTRMATDMQIVNRSMNGGEWLALVLLSVLWGGSFFFAGVLIKT